MVSGPEAPGSGYQGAANRYAEGFERITADGRAFGRTFGMTKPVYLDYAATSPLAGPVFEAMLPWLREGFGNPSSVHAAGRRARNAVEEARDRIARMLNCSSEEIVFTSGGTESNHLAICGASIRGPVFVSRVEHDAVLKAAQSARTGLRWLDVDSDGRLSPQTLPLDEMGGGLLTSMLVNNELGTLNAVRELAEAARSAGALVHTDAVQAPAWRLPNVDELGVDLLSLSAHKMGGPKGVGLLFVRRGTDLSAIMAGGGQERDRRGGTENVAGIVGLAAALAWQEAQGPERAARLSRLTGLLREQLSSAGLTFNSPEEQVAPHILNVGIPGVSPQIGAEMVILGLDLEGIQVSAGSACSSGALNASHVLQAIGKERHSAVRFSVGFKTTEEDIHRAADALKKVVGRVRAAV